MNISNFKHITNSIGQKVFSASGKYTHNNNTFNGEYDPDLNAILPSFNAVEIDWNGYQVDNTGEYGVDYIDTTEDLFTYIRGLVEARANPIIGNHYKPSATNYTNVNFGSSIVKVDAKGHIVS